MKRIFENDYLTFDIDEKNSVVIYVWKSASEDMSEKEFLTEGERLLKNIFKFKLQNIIGDGTNFKFAIAPVLQEKINKTMVEQLNNGFLKKSAHVISKELVVELSIEQLGDENINRTYEDKFFKTFEEAKEWIYNK